ncbi:MAG: heme A synthase [Deltaproteobacteria bacterium]|nr:heme A synthase [Deltaproteobacteria bacterium]
MVDQAHGVSGQRGTGAAWLHRLAVLTAWATLTLIFIGGLVTSTGSGLAVPDWPLSFGQLFPRMAGGVLYEHGHRMAAAFVGLLTTVLAVWMWLKEPRAWLRGLAAAALLAVLLQGVLGGITVLFLLPIAISVAHASVAQAFFCLTVALAVFTGPGWEGPARTSARGSRSPLPRLCAATTAVVYLQLVLGAVMRHMGAGLAIPDFPLAFGRLVPPLDAPGVLIHFLHRVGAVVVTACVLWTLACVVRRHAEEPRLLRPAVGAAGLVAVQLALGALTIWTSRAVLPTTAHVAVGAAVLASSLVLTLRSYQLAGEPRPSVRGGLLSEQVAA